MFLFSNVLAQNSISFENIQLVDNNTITLDMYLTNTDTIAGLQIPIVFPKIIEGFEPDTIYFENGRCWDFEFKYYEFLDSQNGILIHLISNINPETDNKYLLPGHGMICKVHFSWPDSVDIPNINGIMNRGFFVKKAKYLRDKKAANSRDFRFTIWKPDATEVDGRIISLDRNITN